MKTLLITLTCALLLTGCGGNDSTSPKGEDGSDSGAGRPTAAELAGPLKEWWNAGASGDSAAVDKYLECVAQTLVDSEISDEGLQVLADGKEATDMPSKDTMAYINARNKAGKACA